MANSNRIYYSLPTEAPHRSRSGSRRPPLTPSTVSSPCLTTHVRVASRRDSGSSGSPTKASAMLAKVASSPPASRVETPAVNQQPPSGTRAHEDQADPSARPGAWRTESDHYVRQYKQQDGYISFPDFENFHSSQRSFDQHREHTAVKT